MHYLCSLALGIACYRLTTEAHWNPSTIMILAILVLCTVSAWAERARARARREAAYKRRRANRGTN